MSENVQTVDSNPETPIEVTTWETSQETTPNTSSEDKGNRGGRNNDRRGGGGRRENRGMREEEKEFREELLAIDRVTRVTAGWRQLRFRASVVIGDGKGRVGLWIGKSGEVQSAIEKAVRDAKKNLIKLPIVNGTIPHDVSATFKSSSLFIHPASPGTGIIAGWSVRKIFAVSGIKDIIAKQHGAPNRITNARVTMKALTSLKPLNLVVRFDSKGTTADVITSEKKENKPKTSDTKNRSPKKPTV